MPNFGDARGDLIAATHADSARQIDHVIDGYLGARADTRARLETLLANDPACPLAHCLDGYFRMLSSRREGIAHARGALARATHAASRVAASSREALHVAALEAWTCGDMRGATRHWEAILADHPRDVVALKVSQFVLSYLGESTRMRVTVERVLPAWDSAVPGYGFVLGCYAYGLEEAGEYERAESIGRRAVELNPGDIWAAHAVAHVAEMQGRARDGVAWITGIAANWEGCSNFAFHLHWHQALLHLDLGEHDRVLDLYDRQVRRQPSDEYLDMTNAVSLLWRLEQAGADVGTRWTELSACARGHMNDHALVFADLHYLMALAAANDTAAVTEFLGSCERFAMTATGTEATVMADVGLPLARAVVAHRRGAYSDVVDAMLPVRTLIRRVGGSHAQRDVFEQMLIDSALRARLSVATELLAERTTRRPRNIWGWSHYLEALTAQGTPAAGRAAHAARELDRLRGVA